MKPVVCLPGVIIPLQMPTSVSSCRPLRAPQSCCAARFSQRSPLRPSKQVPCLRESVLLLLLDGDQTLRWQKSSAGSLKANSKFLFASFHPSLVGACLACPEPLELTANAAPWIGGGGSSPESVCYVF